jgi:hypothetical protein
LRKEGGLLADGDARGTAAPAPACAATLVLLPADAPPPPTTAPAVPLWCTCWHCSLRKAIADGTRRSLRKPPLSSSLDTDTPEPPGGTAHDVSLRNLLADMCGVPPHDACDLRRRATLVRDER